MSLSSSLVNLNAMTGSSTTPPTPMTAMSATSAVPEIKIVPIDQIHFVCEAQNGALNIFNQMIRQGGFGEAQQLRHQQGVYTPPSQMMPRSGSEDIISTADMPVIEELPSPQRRTMRRGSSF